MAYKDLNQESLGHFMNRISNINERSERRWGTMTPARMLAHVSLLFEGSLGEFPVEGSGQIPFKWLKPIVLSGIVPFPKGRAKAPAAFLDDDAGQVDEERERLEKSLGRFLERCENEPDRCQMNPVFGLMNMRQWARLHGLHLNHHLMQFGV
jgi:hypothetical protein